MCITHVLINLIPTSAGINTFIAIMLLALITSCDGRALLTTQSTHICLILSRAVLNGEKKCSVTQFSQKSPRTLNVFNHGWWQLVVGGWRRLAVGSWQLAVGGGWRRLVVGDWWLVAVGNWRRLVAGGGWWLVVVGGWWELAVGGWWSLGAVLQGGP